MKIVNSTQLRHLVLFVFLLMTTIAFSVPVNHQVTLKQPDGTTLSAWVRGDEFFAYVQTLDGYTILQNEAGYWTYAEVAADGQLMPGPVIYSNLKGSSANMEKGVMPSEEFLSRIARERDNFNRQVSKSLNEIQNQGLKSGQASLYEGVWEVPVLLIDFQDFKHEYTIDDFDQFFHDMDNPDVGSFNAYYHEASYGKFTIKANIFGWITDQNDRSYYANSSGDSQVRCKDMTRRAIDYAEDNYAVDWSKFDNDSDGKVDMVIVVHAGEGAAWGGNNEYIWAHMWWGLNKSYDGKEFDTYTVQPETQDGYISSPGLYCHEFGHALGLPDLYDTSYTSEGIGKWGIMSGGSWNGSGYSPSHFCAFSKFKLGWVNPIELDANGLKPIHNYSDANNDVYRCSTSDPKEYFLVSNRQQNSYDWKIPASGIIIEHVDESKLWNGDNTDRNHMLCEIIQADGKWDLYHKNNSGDEGDVFPGTADVRAINSATTPNTKTYDGSSSDLFMSAISDSDMDMSFVFGYNETDGPIADFSTVNEGVVGSPVLFASNCMGENLIYQWNFPGATPESSSDAAPAVSYTSIGSYSVSLTVSNEHGEDTKTMHGYVNVKDYCQPISKDGTGNDYISNVRIGDIAYSSEFDGYADRRSQLFSITANTSVNLEVDLANMYSNTRVYAWVDWNQNNAFDVEELTTFDAQTGQNIVLSEVIHVPSSVNAGDLFVMRVRSIWTDPVKPAISCGEYYGETEDYSLYVGAVENIELAHCDCEAKDGSGGDNIDQVRINARTFASEWSAYTSFANEIVDIPQNKDFTVEVHIANYYDSDQAFGWVDWNRNDVYETGEQIVFSAYQSQTAKAKVTPPAEAEGQYAMRIRNQYGNAVATSCGKDVYGEVEDYVINLVPGNGIEFTLCESASLVDLGNDYIDNVVLNGRNYPSGYSLYTDNTHFTIDLGELQEIELIVSLANAYGDQVFGWIDWNKNNAFEASEEVEFSDLSNDLLAEAIVAIPVDADGVYALRVRNQYDEMTPNACGSDVYGEVEDYAIRLSSPTTTALENELIREQSLHLFPNPVKDQLSIQCQLEKQGLVEIAVFNVTGQQVIYRSIEAVTTDFGTVMDFTTLSKGIYLVKVSFNGQEEIRKVIK